MTTTTTDLDLVLDANRGTVIELEIKRVDALSGGTSEQDWRGIQAQMRRCLSAAAKYRELHPRRRGDEGRFEPRTTWARTLWIKAGCP